MTKGTGKARPRVRGTKEALLSALAENRGYILQSCRTVGISRQTFYRWKDEDPTFAEDVELVYESLERKYYDVLEQLVLTGHSEKLLMFTLRGLNPERWAAKPKPELPQESEDVPPVTVILVRDEEPFTADRYGPDPVVRRSTGDGAVED